MTLDLGRYLLGAAEIGALAGFAWLGASRLRSRLLPDFSGAPAHLATGVLALTLLIWVAELLGSFGLFEAVPYLAGVAVIGLGVWALACGKWVFSSFTPAGQDPRAGARSATPATGSAGRSTRVAGVTLVALLLATAAAIHFAAGARLRLSTGMTGFDSTWYHGPFAAGFFQSGSTWDLHYIAPQFLAWFYPANAEILHAAGMLAFHRDLLSPLLNLGWFVGCLVAVWCIGRPFGVAPWSLALGAVALSVPALADQAGEARNDIVGIFFLLAAVAIALNALSVGAEDRMARPLDDASGEPSDNPRKGPVDERMSETTDGPSSDSGDSPDLTAEGDRDSVAGPLAGGGLPVGALIVAGLAAGLAGGTKLNFLLPALVLVAGLVAIAPRGARGRALAATGLAALGGGGYWYQRNLAHSGNPLPWFGDVGPISLPAPEQALGGREGHSVVGYLTDGSVWSGWFLPGLHDGLTALWPLLVVLALAGLVLSLVPMRTSAKQTTATPGAVRLLPVMGLVGLAAAIAWLIAPTSASGPAGEPRGFESGLRYLAPALILGLALLPIAPPLRARLRRRRFGTAAGRGKEAEGAIEAEDVGRGAGGRSADLGAGVPAGSTSARTPTLNRQGFAGSLARRRGLAGVAVALAFVAAIAIGYPVQRHYLQNRYASPEFTMKGLDAAFRWARSISGARIATTSTRQYPLFGTDLSNRVQFVGIQRPHGGFVAPSTCRAWRHALNAGRYDYAVVTRDRIEPGQPTYPPAVHWTEGPNAHTILRTPPTVVFRLTGPLDPSSCP